MGAIALLASCERPRPVVLPLLLVAPATLTPTAATVCVGDTLWVEAHYSDSLLNLNSNQRTLFLALAYLGRGYFSEL